MCGLAGFLTGFVTPELDESLKQICSTLIHRGPDSSGVWTHVKRKRSMGLAHTRLSILDLSDLGHQPYSKGSNSIVLSYNGEVYNYLELRLELESLGCEFVSNCDTEVVFEAYRMWGKNAFERFNGMWAIAILDLEQDTLVLSRDRIGQKPLFYYEKDKDIYFASEIKALLEFQKFGLVFTPDYEKVYRQLALSYRYFDSSSDTNYKEVKQVPSGTIMSWNLNGEFLGCHKYWELTQERYLDITETEAIDRFRELFFSSVEFRLRSDVDVGCLLSGGLDSTSIACVAHKVLGKDVTLFSGITGELKGVYDESEFIHAIENELGVSSNYIGMKPSELLSVIDEMVQAYDEPVCTVSWYSLYLIVKEIARQNCRVVLSGHGGDELLAGYRDHYHYFFHYLRELGNQKELDYQVACWKEKQHSKSWDDELTWRESYIAEMIGNRDLEHTQFNDYSNVFHSDFLNKYQNYPQYQGYFHDELDRRLRWELLYEVTPTMVKSDDRNTMAHSIESRCPFLDYRLMDFCFALPHHFKIRDGVGKWLLRESMKGILPEKVRTRTDKVGLIAPADLWFRIQNRKDITKLLESHHLCELGDGMLRVDEVKRLFLEHLSGDKNHQMFFWQLLNLNSWFEQYFH